MAFIRSEEEVEIMIEEMKKRTKGKYITQGVTFNKESQRQMDLLKFALMSATTFSGLGKELLAAKLNGFESWNNSPQKVAAPIEKKDVGNFMLD